MKRVIRFFLMSVFLIYLGTVCAQDLNRNKPDEKDETHDKEDGVIETAKSVGKIVMKALGGISPIGSWAEIYQGGVFATLQSSLGMTSRPEFREPDEGAQRSSSCRKVVYSGRLVFECPSAKQQKDELKEKAKSFGKFVLKTAVISGAFIGGATYGLPLIGFGALGPTAGSLAATYQSTVLGGTIASGSVFATLQSLGMAGLSGAAKAGIVGASTLLSAFTNGEVESKKETSSDKN